MCLMLRPELWLLRTKKDAPDDKTRALAAKSLAYAKAGKILMKNQWSFKLKMSNQIGPY